MAIVAGEAVVRFGADLKPISKAVSEATKGMEKSFGGLMNVSKQVGTAFTGIGLAITGALGVAVKNFSDTGTAILEMSRKTGLSTESVSKWGAALDQSGSSSEALNTMMTSMAKSMDVAGTATEKAAEAQEEKLNKAMESGGEKSDALGKQYNTTKQKLDELDQKTRQHMQSMRESGASNQKISEYYNTQKAKADELTKKMGELNAKHTEAAAKINATTAALIAEDPELTGAADAYKRLGIDIANFKTLDTEKRFETLAFAIAAIVDPQERAALAMKVFGKSGTELLPVLAGGEAGLKSFFDELARSNGIWTPEEAAAAAAFDEAMGNLTASFAGVSKALVTDLSQSLIIAIEWIKETVQSTIAWIKANPELTATLVKIVAVVGAVMMVLGPLLMMLPGLAVAWRGLATALTWTQASADAAKAAQIALDAATKAGTATTAAGTIATNAATVATRSLGASMLIAAGTIAAVVALTFIAVVAIGLMLKAFTLWVEARRGQAAQEEQANAAQERLIGILEQQGVMIDRVALKEMTALEQTKFLAEQSNALRDSKLASQQNEAAETVRLEGVKIQASIAALRVQSGLNQEEIAQIGLMDNTRANSILQYIETMRASGASIDQITTGVRDMLGRLSLDHRESPSINDMAASGFNSYLDMVYGLGNQLAGLLDGIRNLWINTWTNISSAVSGIIAGIVNAAQSALASIGINVGMGGIAGNAAGTDSWRGGLTRINEQGGEILNLPRGTQIIPHDVSVKAAAQSMGGGSIVVNVTGNTVRSDSDIKAIGREMERALQRALSQRGMRMRTA